MKRALLVTLATLALGLGQSELGAQIRLAPEIVHSNIRNYGAGLRVSWSPRGSTGIYAEAVEFFQNEDQFAEPGVGTDAVYRQLNAGLVVSGDPRTLQPYAGGGGGWFYSRLRLDWHDNVATANRSGFLGHLFMGLRMPRPRFTPYAEMKRIVNDTGQWVVSAGVDFTLR